MEAHETSGRVLTDGVQGRGVGSAAELGLPDVLIQRSPDKMEEKEEERGRGTGLSWRGRRPGSLTSGQRKMATERRERGRIRGIRGRRGRRTKGEGEDKDAKDGAENKEGDVQTEVWRYLQLHLHKRIWEEQNKQDEVLFAPADDGDRSHTSDDGFHPPDFPSGSHQATFGQTRQYIRDGEKKEWGLRRQEEGADEWIPRPLQSEEGHLFLLARIHKWKLLSSDP